MIQILPLDLNTDFSLLYIPSHSTTWLLCTQPGTWRKAIWIVHLQQTQTHLQCSDQKAIIKHLLNWLLRWLLWVKFQPIHHGQDIFKDWVFLLIATLNSTIFSMEGTSIDAWRLYFNKWIILWPNTNTGSNWWSSYQNSIEPLVLVQARTNSTLFSGKSCLLGPLAVMRGMV